MVVLQWPHKVVGRALGHHILQVTQVLMGTVCMCAVVLTSKYTPVGINEPLLLICCNFFFRITAGIAVQKGCILNH